MLSLVLGGSADTVQASLVALMVSVAEVKSSDGHSVLGKIKKARKRYVRIAEDNKEKKAQASQKLILFHLSNLK